MTDQPLMQSDLVLPSTLSELLADFLLEYSGNTVTAYSADLRDYLTWCQQGGCDPLKARRATVSAYLRALEQRGLAPSTVARRLAAIRGFYRYIVDEEHLTASPAERVRTPRGTSLPTQPLDADALRRLLAAADDYSPFASASVALLAGTGLRISEATNATGGDLTVSEDRSTLWVVRKGNRPGVVLVPPFVTERLQRLGNDGPNCPLLNVDGQRVTRQRVTRLLSRLQEPAGVAGHLSPHVLRHTFVTLAAAEGCPLDDIRDAVGHADTRTTRHYNHAGVKWLNHPGLSIERTVGAA